MMMQILQSPLRHNGMRTLPLYHHGLQASNDWWLHTCQVNISSPTFLVAFVPCFWMTLFGRETLAWSSHLTMHCKAPACSP